MSFWLTDYFVWSALVRLRRSLQFVSTLSIDNLDDYFRAFNHSRNSFDARSFSSSTAKPPGCKRQNSATSGVSRTLQTFLRPSGAGLPAPSRLPPIMRSPAIGCSLQFPFQARSQSMRLACGLSRILQHETEQQPMGDYLCGSCRFPTLR